MTQYMKGVMPMDEISLSCLNTGKKGIITSVNLEHPYRERLAQLGFVPGTEVCMIHTAPSGSPAAFHVKGTVVALRHSDSSRILVTPDDTH